MYCCAVLIREEENALLRSSVAARPPSPKCGLSAGRDAAAELIEMCVKACGRSVVVINPVLVEEFSPELFVLEKEQPWKLVGAVLRDGPKSARRSWAVFRRIELR